MGGAGLNGLGMAWVRDWSGAEGKVLFFFLYFFQNFGGGSRSQGKPDGWAIEIEMSIILCLFNKKRRFPTGTSFLLSKILKTILKTIQQ